MNRGVGSAAPGLTLVQTVLCLDEGSWKLFVLRSRLVLFSLAEAFIAIRNSHLYRSESRRKNTRLW